MRKRMQFSQQFGVLLELPRRFHPCFRLGENFLQRQMSCSRRRSSAATRSGRCSFRQPSCSFFHSRFKFLSLARLCFKGSQLCSREDRGHHQFFTWTIESFQYRQFPRIMLFVQAKLCFTASHFSAYLSSHLCLQSISPVHSYSKKNIHSQCLLAKVPLLSSQRSPCTRSLIKYPPRPARGLNVWARKPE